MRVKKLLKIFPGITCTSNRPGSYIVKYRSGCVKKFNTIKSAYIWLKDNMNTTSDQETFQIEYDEASKTVTTQYSNRHGYQFTHIWNTYSELQYQDEYNYTCHFGEMGAIGGYLVQM